MLAFLPQLMQAGTLRVDRFLWLLLVEDLLRGTLLYFLAIIADCDGIPHVDKALICGYLWPWNIKPVCFSKKTALKSPSFDLGLASLSSRVVMVNPTSTIDVPLIYPWVCHGRMNPHHRMGLARSSTSVSPATVGIGQQEKGQQVEDHSSWQIIFL